MIDIPFNYKITRVDEQHQTIEIEYSAEGYESVLVSAPIPHDDVDLDGFIRSYAPMYNWVISKKKLMKIAPGLTGTIQPLPHIGNPGMDLSAQIGEDEILRMIQNLKSGR